MQSPAKLLRAVAAGAAAVVLAWMAAAGSVTIGRLFVRDLAVEGKFDTEEERVARALGAHYETLELLREHAPEDAILFCGLHHAPTDPRAGDDLFLLNRLRHALHPRAVYGVDLETPAGIALLAPHPKLWVCVFDSQRALPLPDFLERRALTDRVELWSAEGGR